MNMPKQNEPRELQGLRVPQVPPVSRVPPGSQMVPVRQIPSGVQTLLIPQVPPLG